MEKQKIEDRTGNERERERDREKRRNGKQSSVMQNSNDSYTSWENVEEEIRTQTSEYSSIYTAILRIWLNFVSFCFYIQGFLRYYFSRDFDLCMIRFVRNSTRFFYLIR